MLARLVGRVREFVGRLFGRAEETADPEILPETTEGTIEPLREAVRGAIVPRRLVGLRTRAFTGLAGAALLLFGALTVLVTTGATAEPDLAASVTVQQAEHPWLGALMVAVSALGFPPINLALIAGVGTLLWLAGYRVESRFATLAGIGGVLTQGVKLLVGRPRPEAGVVRVAEAVPGHSFPSGHTFFYVTFFGYVAYLSYALLKPGRLRTLLLWLSGALIVLVGPSRVWLGHHWASDVLASYALGVAYLILLVRLYHRARLEPVATAR